MKQVHLIYELPLYPIDTKKDFFHHFVLEKKIKKNDEKHLRIQIYCLRNFSCLVKSSKMISQKKY